jgi:hypothetical protein
MENATRDDTEKIGQSGDGLIIMDLHTWPIAKAKLHWDR